MSRAVLCEVRTRPPIMPDNPKPKPVIDRIAAAKWINEVGSAHVTGEPLCDLPKCVSSRKFLKEGWVYISDRAKAKTRGIGEWYDWRNEEKKKEQELCKENQPQSLLQ